MWSPPAFVRGRASTVNSVVASRNTSAEQHFEESLQEPHAFETTKHFVNQHDKQLIWEHNKTTPLKVTMETHKAITT